MLRSDLYGRLLHALKVELKSVNKQIYYIDRYKNLFTPEVRAQRLLERDELIEKREYLKTEIEKTRATAKRALSGEQYWRDHA